MEKVSDVRSSASVTNADSIRPNSLNAVGSIAPTSRILSVGTPPCRPIGCFGSFGASAWKSLFERVSETMPAELDVWLHGVRVATLREVRTRKLRLDYTDAAADAFRIGAPVLSVAMPLNTHRRYPPGIVDPWLEGLLPEGEARTSIERTYGVLRGDAVGLLRAVGRDCAGAVVIQPPGQAPPSTVGGLAAVALSPQDLADELGRLGHRPLGADRSVRVSLAGQQPKLLLTRTSSGVWARPTADAPSTWILKPQVSRRRRTGPQSPSGCRDSRHVGCRRRGGTDQACPRRRLQRGDR